SSSVTSLLALCASRITTTQLPPNSDGAVSDATSPGLNSPPVTSWTSAAVTPGAAVTSRATARSTSSSSSPTTATATPLAVPPAAAREAMPEACHGGGGPDGGSAQHWLATPPDL